MLEHNLNGEIISYLELCNREKAHLQHGMKWRNQPSHSVFLMSTRKGAPCDDKIEDEGRTLIYEGHDAPKNTTDKDPKTIDQPGFSPSGKRTRNGIFALAAEAYKSGRRHAENRAASFLAALCARIGLIPIDPFIDGFVERIQRALKSAKQHGIIGARSEA